MDLWQLWRVEGERLEPRARVVGFETALAERLRDLLLRMLRILEGDFVDFFGCEGEIGRRIR